ncbi:hypothetical protein D3C72_709020 [compost metagenome]
MQQQHRRLKGRVRLEARLHRAAQQHVGDRQQAHALVMRHVRLDDGAVLARGLAARRVVDGFIEAVAAHQLVLGQPLQIAAGCVRHHHQRQHRRIRRHDHVIGQPALQAQARHAKRAVLVVHAAVEQVVGAFGHAPGNAQLVAVVDLRAHGGQAGLVQQGMGVGRHDEPGHQVLEHGAAPGQEHRTARRVAQLAAQREPGLLRQLALRDCHEAAQPGLGRQQVVQAVVASAFRQVVADGQQAAALVVQESVFGHRHVGQCVGQMLQARAAFGGAFTRRHDGLFGGRQPRAFVIGRVGFGVTRADGRQQRRALGGDLLQGGYGQQRRKAAPGDVGGHVRPWGQLREFVARGFALAQHGLAMPQGFGVRGAGVALQQAVGQFAHPFQALPGLGQGQGGARGMSGRRGLQGLQHLRHQIQLRQPRGGDVFAQHRQRVGQAFEGARMQNRRVRQLQQSGAQGQQMACQVAAVHRRDIQRVQGFERLRVVPVVEVAQVAFQLPHGGQRGLRAVKQPAGLQIAEIVGGQVGQQGQPQVGGRGAMRGGGRGQVLDVVGNQPVVLGAAMAIKEGPGLARQQAQELFLRGREPNLGGCRGSAHVPGDQRHQRPQRQYRQGGRQGGWVPAHDAGADGQGQQRRAPHGQQQRPRARGAFAVGQAGRLPFQQPPARHCQPVQRAHDGVQVVQGFVRQAGQREGRARELPRRRRNPPDQMLRQHHVLLLSDHAHGGREQGRHEQHQQADGGP